MDCRRSVRLRDSIDNGQTACCTSRQSIDQQLTRSSGCDSGGGARAFRRRPSTPGASRRSPARQRASVWGLHAGWRSSMLMRASSGRSGCVQESRGLLVCDDMSRQKHVLGLREARKQKCQCDNPSHAIHAIHASQPSSYPSYPIGLPGRSARRQPAGSLTSLSRPFRKLLPATLVMYDTQLMIWRSAASMHCYNPISNDHFSNDHFPQSHSLGFTVCPEK